MLPMALAVKLARKPAIVGVFQFTQQARYSFCHYALFPNTLHSISQLVCYLQREMHSRNKKAMELIAKGWSALKEVDRVIDYAELNDRRLIPLLRV